MGFRLRSHEIACFCLFAVSVGPLAHAMLLALERFKDVHTISSSPQSPMDSNET